MKLDSKVAVVTGSVRGLGWEIAHAYALEGAKVVICDLDQSDVDATVARLGLPAEGVLGVAADVSLEEDVIRLVQRIREKFDRIDVWVNNAGFAWPRGGPIDLEVVDTPFDVWLKVLNTNLTGTFLCSREVLKVMREQRNGSIINISSPQGKSGKPLRGPYCAAKFGIEGLSQVLSMENTSYNIRINTLDPGGMVATEVILKIHSNKGFRMLSPSVIRDCAVFLASDDATGTTGRSFVASDWNREHGIDVEYSIR